MACYSQNLLSESYHEAKQQQMFDNYSPLHQFTTTIKSLVKIFLKFRARGNPMGKVKNGGMMNN